MRGFRRKSAEAAFRWSAVVFTASVALLAGACGDNTAQEEEAPAGDSAMMEGSTGQGTQVAAGGAEVYEVPGEEVFPEGVAYDEDTGSFFVGSTTDGTVYRGSVEGDAREMEVFLEPGEDGRTTAVGMNIDDENLLYISGGETGMSWVYDIQTGDLVTSYETPETDATFINDVAVTPNGDAYFTDSMRPVLFKVPSGSTEPEMQSWLDLEGSPIEYTDGFNLNGIASTEDGRYLVVVQSGTGQLFRIDAESQEVVEIDLGGETVTNGDGILLEGQTLYVVRNQQGVVVPVEMNEDFTTGDVGEGFSDPSFAYPTTIAGYGEETPGRLLVVNAQFDERGGDPETPFTISGVEIP